MATLQGTRAEDFVEAPPAGAIDPAPLVGNWLNTDKESKGIVRIVAAVRDGAFTLRAFGAGSPEPFDWGEVRAGVYADSAGSKAAAAFGAVYDHGFLRVNLQAKVNRGVLVLAVFNQFTDGSGRSGYFNREFFHR